MILLVLLSWEAAQRGVADLHQRHVRHYFGLWETELKRVRLADWRAALASAESAQRLNPHSPDLFEDLGRLYDWAAFGKPEEQRVVVAYREQALVYFHAAVRERPVSGVTWANIAQARLAVRAVDSEFAKALRLAAFLAPWEPGAQLSVVRSGLSAWNKLDSRTREVVLRTAERALTRHTAEVVEIAKVRARTREICGLPTLSRDAAALVCQ